MYVAPMTTVDIEHLLRNDELLQLLDGAEQAGSLKATELADRRRHFVREEVEACKEMDAVDVLLTHEAPRPFRVGAGGRGNDAGKTPINEILAAMKPRLHLFGHHHRFVGGHGAGDRRHQVGERFAGAGAGLHGQMFAGVEGVGDGLGHLDLTAALAPAERGDRGGEQFGDGSCVGRGSS